MIGYKPADPDHTRKVEDRVLSIFAARPYGASVSALRLRERRSLYSPTGRSSTGAAVGFGVA